jgi:hypothetical protein
MIDERRPMRVNRQWFQRYSDEGEPLDEWYEQIVASIRHNGREYATARDPDKFDEAHARHLLDLAIASDIGAL